MKMPLETIPWDVAELLETKEDIAAYLNAAFEDGDPDVIKLALRNIARAKGMPELARGAGVEHARLYTVLAPDGEPNFASVASALKVIGIPLSAAA